MPEVSEVALTAEILCKLLKKHKLIEIKFISGRYLKKTPDNFSKFQKSFPLKLKEVNSKGKFMWFKLSSSEKKGKSISPSLGLSKGGCKPPLFSDNKNWFIFNTFGLTGMWSTEKTKHSRIKLVFLDKKKNKQKIYYEDQLGWGSVSFVNSEQILEKKLKTLGIDLLKEEFTEKDFWKRIKLLQKHKKYKDMKIVEALMNQKIIGSGIGNYLVAEILYRAKISPHRKIKKLSKEDSYYLSKKIKYTIKLSYFNNITGYMKYLTKNLPKEYYKPKNYHPEIKLGKDKFEFLVYSDRGSEKKTDSKGNKIKKEIIITTGQYKNRKTHWVPDVQK